MLVLRQSYRPQPQAGIIVSITHSPVRRQKMLDAFKADFEAGKPPYSVPPSVIETMHRATAELIASGAAGCALKVGDKAPGSAPATR